MLSFYELENNKPILFWSGILIFLELLSGLAWFYNPLAIVFFIVLTGILIFAYRQNKSWLVLLPLLELFWGSMGRSIEYGFFSLRWLIFIITILFFLIANFGKYKSLKIFQNQAIGRIFVIYICLMIFLVLLAIINRHSLSNIFFDANAYLFFLYLPIWLEYYDGSVFKKIVNILLASCLVIAVKTIIVFYLFTQSSFDLVGLYKWVRDTRTGEITRLDNGFARIFFQSQIYLLLAWSIIFDRVIKYRPRGDRPPLGSEPRGRGLDGKLNAKKFFYLVILSTAIYISLSRSLWLGLLLIIITLLILNKKILVSLRYLFFIGLTTYALVVVLFNIPKYHQINLLNNRSLSSQEAALSTRTLLLPVMLDSIYDSPIIGHGFGQELTFLSNDPRSKNAQNPNGQRTTFSFEWGWLDFMLKGGLLLPLFFVYSLVYIIRALYVIIRSKPEFIAWLAMFLALPLIHVFTPYLNHPLGLGLLILGLINTKNYV
ncbi:MAG: O-antigen ligase family protein [Patescibacteria group bacterium]|jgi:O-antigen ligase